MRPIPAKWRMSESGQVYQRQNALSWPLAPSKMVDMYNELVDQLDHCHDTIRELRGQTDTETEALVATIKRLEGEITRLRNALRALGDDINEALENPQ